FHVTGVQTCALPIWVGAALGLALIGLAGGLSAQDAEAPADPDVLKRLTLEELLALEVTSSSRTPVPIAQVAASIRVLTQDQIRQIGRASWRERERTS